MPSVIKSNITPFIQGRVQNRAKFLDAVSNRLGRAELLFIGDIKAKQMSGQHGSTGTNVITGMLRRQWYNTTIRQNQSVQALVWSTTPYAPLHEDGGIVRIPGHTVRAHMRRGKKGGSHPVRAHAVASHWVQYHARLRIGEAWERDFVPEMTRIITQAAKEFL